jgi:hypothetical protein
MDEGTGQECFKSRLCRILNHSQRPIFDEAQRITQPYGGTHYLPASWGKSTNLNRWMSQLMIKPFSSVLLSGTHMVSTATVAGVVLIACPIPALAQTASINATQLSIDVAPITITGTRMGGSMSASGNGLSNTPTLPTVTVTGATTAGTAFTTNTGATFNYDVSARAADGSTTLAVGAAGAPVAGDFGSQSGRFSAASNGALAITDANAATITAGTAAGTTATAIFSTTMNTGTNEAQVRRVATSSNNQATFTAERQGARYQHGGSGLTSVGTGGTLGAAGVGVAATLSVSTGGDAASAVGVAFTRTEAVQTGQASASLSNAASAPAYGITTQVIGGTTAGAITSTNMNTLTNLAGGAGTSASLSVIQSLTAF